MPALADSTQDIFGIGARNKAMAGTGTAHADDYTAAFYNPANMAFCPSTNASIEVGRVTYGLDVDGGEGLEETAPMRDRLAFELGACLRLPLDFAFGAILGAGSPAQSLRQTSPDETPRFPLYGNNTEQMTVLLGVAWKAFDLPVGGALSVGAGVSILVSSDLVIVNQIPIVTEGETISNAVNWDLEPIVAPYLGVHYRPTPALKLSAVYRGAMFHELVARAPTRVVLAGAVLDVALRLEAVSWYSPQQASGGVAWDPVDPLTVSFDATWYDWSSYPGPFIQGATEVTDDVNVGDILAFPPAEDNGFTDIVAPRLGVEWRFIEDARLRAGYGLRPTPAPAPSGRANLLDQTTHIVSGGGGYRWSFPDRDAPGEEFHVDLDAYVSAQLMPPRQVSKTGADGQPIDYEFGGHVIDAGLGVKLTWD
jgi:hypothetical protein